MDARGEHEPVSVHQDVVLTPGEALGDLQKLGQHAYTRDGARKTPGRLADRRL